jgi:hypothetical protein
MILLCARLQRYVDESPQDKCSLREHLPENGLTRLLPALPALSAGGHLCLSAPIPDYSPSLQATCRAIPTSVVPEVMSQTDVKDVKTVGCLGKLLLAGSFWRVFRNTPTSLAF